MEMVIYNAFRKAGVADSDAQIIAADLAKAFEQNYAVHSQNLATQGDTERVRFEIEQLRRETKVDIEKVRAEIEKAKFTIIGSVVAIAAVSLAAARFLFGSG